MIKGVCYVGAEGVGGRNSVGKSRVASGAHLASEMACRNASGNVGVHCFDLVALVINPLSFTLALRPFLFHLLFYSFLRSRSGTSFHVITTRGALYVDTPRLPFLAIKSAFSAEPMDKTRLSWQVWMPCFCFKTTGKKSPWTCEVGA